MKMLTILVFGSLVATSAFASVDNIFCELNYNEKIGDTVVVVTDSAKPVKAIKHTVVLSALHGFELKVELTPICPADGSCGDGDYSAVGLSLKLQKGDLSSYTNVDININEKYPRAFLHLDIGQESAYVLCQSND